MSEKVYGLHAVRALLLRHAARVSAVTVVEGRADPRAAEILELAQKAGKSVKRAPPATFKQFGEAVHQGVYADVQPLAPWREEELVAGITRALEAGYKPLVLVLDGVQDPHNLGACLRTADACGALAVVIPKDRAVQMNATVRKVAAGAAETLPLAVVTNLARALRLLKDAGLWIVGADAEATKLAQQTDLAGPIALVMGAEGAGLRQLTRDTCDYLVRLPQQGTVESLNVSVATGMLLYEAVRQRIGPGTNSK
ncbi:MAG TPA: 23S rRNA (guanosine(2251)-2'-O)-methyltransferase RlmB [Steroidobacteraceae bacterium]|nr:23S rRNA (guanosine(2251)-2'-O)-methyltransferase RlmB [Steroidobacteraceae bacterium]